MLTKCRPTFSCTSSMFTIARIYLLLQFCVELRKPCCAESNADSVHIACNKIKRSVCDKRKFRRVSRVRNPVIRRIRGITFTGVYEIDRLDLLVASNIASSSRNHPIACSYCTWELLISLYWAILSDCRL